MSDCGSVTRKILWSSPPRVKRPNLIKRATRKILSSCSCESFTPRDRGDTSFSPVCEFATNGGWNPKGVARWYPLMTWKTPMGMTFGKKNGSSKFSWWFWQPLGESWGCQSWHIVNLPKRNRDNLNNWHIKMWNSIDSMGFTKAVLTQHFSLKLLRVQTIITHGIPGWSERPKGSWYPVTYVMFFEDLWEKKIDLQVDTMDPFQVAPPFNAYDSSDFFKCHVNFQGCIPVL